MRAFTVAQSPIRKTNPPKRRNDRQFPRSDVLPRGIRSIDQRIDGSSLRSASAVLDAPVRSRSSRVYTRPFAFTQSVYFLPSPDFEYRCELMCDPVSRRQKRSADLAAALLDTGVVDSTLPCSSLTLMEPDCAHAVLAQQPISNENKTLFMTFSCGGGRMNASARWKDFYSRLYADTAATIAIGRSMLMPSSAR